MIRIPKGGGVAGYVATTGETANVPNAYDDPRFSQEVAVAFCPCPPQRYHFSDPFDSGSRGVAV
jgi:hypothetical protein